MENKKNVYLIEDSGECLLRFELDEQCKMDININSKEQSYLRKLFYKVIELALVEKFEFQLVVDKNFNKILYKEISEEYIKQLNIELNKIYDDIPEEVVN